MLFKKTKPQYSASTVRKIIWPSFGLLLCTWAFLLKWTVNYISSVNLWLCNTSVLSPGKWFRILIAQTNRQFFHGRNKFKQLTQSCYIIGNNFPHQSIFYTINTDISGILKMYSIYYQYIPVVMHVVRQLYKKAIIHAVLYQWESNYDTRH